MPTRLSGFELGLDKDVPGHVAFSIADDSKLIPCRIAFAVIEGLSGSSGESALALFHDRKAEIVDAAISKYEREGASGGTVTLSSEDFRG